MEMDLICSKNLERIIGEILSNRKITISKDSKVCIIERGFELEKGKIGIYFDMESINVLMDYLDYMASNKEDFKNVITGKCDDNELKVLTYDDIYYFEAMGNDVFCRTVDKKYKVKEKLYELEERLQSKGFVRISKCFIVNIVKVDRIISWFNSKLILKIIGIDEEIYVTRKYLTEFKKFLGF